MANYNIPEVLKQKLHEVEGRAKTIATQIQPSKEIAQTTGTSTFENGHFLLWKGIETGLFCVVGNPDPGSLIIYDYRHGTEHAQPCLRHRFGRAALIADVLYFPLAADHPGIVVAVSDRSMSRHGDFLAYFSLRSCRLLSASYLPFPITALCAILDGSAERSQFTRMASSFHNDWPHILLVGCRYGYVSLVHLDLTANDDLDQPSPMVLQTVSNSPQSAMTRKTTDPPPIQPIRCKKNVHLSKIFYEDEMFVFRADDGTTRCQPKDQVSVSALHWLEKSGLALIGFNFGGIMVISLRTSKVYSLMYMDGVVQHFAIQEPEEDPRPMLFCWIAYNCYPRGHSLLLCNINFPKDEERAKRLSAEERGGVKEHDFLEPFFSPFMKWSPDLCSRLITMRTIIQPKRSATNSDNNISSVDLAPSTSNLIADRIGQDVLRQSANVDTSLMFVAWIEATRRGETRLHGALFDLNAFYAKRLIPRIQPDSTVARQIPFLARFSSPALCTNKYLDIVSSGVRRFAPPAYLSDTIDQLYYPSTYYIYNNVLSSTRVFQMKVVPIQVQLISELSNNFIAHFEQPHEPAKWVLAIGLANSAPSSNINEERVCLLRVIMHSYFPGIISLIDSAADNVEWLRFLHKWIWKELEITKTKFDDLCSPLFANPPHDLSPSARGYVHHARAFFRRASLVLAHLHAKVSKMDDHQWSQAIAVQGQTARQVRLYSSAIAFALLYGLLPLDALNCRLYTVVAEQFQKRAEKAKLRGKTLQIHKLVDDIIQLNQDQDEELWQGRAEDWYPPKAFSNFLPILLLINISEAAKLSLLGYFCLDLEAAAETFGSEVEAKDASTPPSMSFRAQMAKSVTNSNSTLKSFRDRKFFSLLFSFLCQDDLSLEEMNRVKTMWLGDKRMAEVNPEMEKLLLSLSNGPAVDEQAKMLERLKWLPLYSAADFRKLQDEFLKLDWGVFRYNELMLDRRHFNHLLDVPPLEGNEPEFVQRCHARCLDTRRRFPGLFMKVKPLPAFILERIRQNALRQNQNSLPMPQHSADMGQSQIILPLNIRHDAIASSTAIAPFSQQDVLQNRYGKRTMASLMTNGGATMAYDDGSTDETVDVYEELPLTIATPRKRQRVMMFEGTSTSFADGQPQENGRYLTLNEDREEQPTTPEGTNGKVTPNQEKSPVACNIIQKGSVKARDWERIVRVTQTPVSLRKCISASKVPMRIQQSVRSSAFIDPARTVLFPFSSAVDEVGDGGNQQSTPEPVNDHGESRDQQQQQEQISPVPNMASRPEQPTSILKSDKRQSRLPPDSLSTRPKLRFAQALFTTEQIPSRAEKAIDERQDTSFSNFATLSPSESSASASALLASPGSGTKTTSLTQSQSQSAESTSSSLLARKRGRPMEEEEEEAEAETQAPLADETPQAPTTRKRGRPSNSALPPEITATIATIPVEIETTKTDAAVAAEEIPADPAITTAATADETSLSPMNEGEGVQTRLGKLQDFIAQHTRSKTPDKQQEAVAQHTRSKTPDKQQEAVALQTRSRSKTPELVAKQAKTPSPPTTRRRGRPPGPKSPRPPTTPQPPKRRGRPSSAHKQQDKQ